MNTITDIRDILKQRILILDGAMGTMIQRYQLEEEDFSNEELQNHQVQLKGNNDLLSITRPDVIKEIHAAYLEAGADIVETNTFGSTWVAQADYKLEGWVERINYEAAKIAKATAEEFTARTPCKPRFVAGSIGPTNKLASMSPDVNDPGYRAITFDQLKDAFSAQATALLDGGADILLVETITDTLNAKAALMAIDEIAEARGISIPTMVSATITDASGRVLSGQNAEAFLISVSHLDLLSVGLNCALGARDLKPYLHVLSSKSNFNISAHPNAGLPNEFGAYDETPEDMAGQIKAFLDDGLINIIGGCCGTTPKHIKAIAELAASYKPREAGQQKTSESRKPVSFKLIH